jgi:hypothetical protein
MRSGGGERRLLQTTLLLAGLIAALACERSPDRDSSSSNDGSPSVGPTLSVSAPRHDFGRVVQGDQLQHSFVVQNTGSEALRIEKIEPGFRCTGRAARNSVDPGQQVEVRVTCHPNLFGAFTSSLVVHSNARTEARQKLEVSADVTPLLRFERDLVEVRVPFGQERSEEVRLKGTRAAEVRLKIKQPAQAGFETDILRAEDGKPQGLRFRCEGKKVGTSVHRIVATTGLEAPTEVSLSVTCRVAGTLEVSPTNPYLNLRQPDAKVRVVTVRSSQPDFAVRNVRILEGPFSASVKPGASPGEFRVKVQVEEARLADETRAVKGKLLIVSNDRTEPKKEVPLLGFGKLRRSAAAEAGAAP